MNDAIRTERIHMLNLLLQGTALSEKEPDPEHLLTVGLVFEARGELLRWEDYGNPGLRKFHQRVPTRLLEALVAAYRKELETLPLCWVRASDPDSSQMVFSLHRREDIESAFLMLQKAALERGLPPGQLSGFNELWDELQAWDAEARECVDSKIIAWARSERPPRR
jgi:hypothetical protein